MGKVGHQSSTFFLRWRLHRILYFLHAIGCVESGSGIAYNESGRHHFWAQMRSAVSVSPAARSR